MNRMQKSDTDQFWDKRARTEEDDAKVNISDTTQRDFELDFVLPNILPTDRVVEIGCGNGFVAEKLRQKAAFVDSFDYSANMVDRARSTFGEQNNRFFQDSILDPRDVAPPYDVAICIRVLINLRNLEEQIVAVQNIAAMLRPGGRLILVEGYKDGFETLNELRQQVGIPAMKPAAINFYSYLCDLRPVLEEYFEVHDAFHTGLFDLLTRVVYPTLVGAEKATGHAEFHERLEPLVRVFNVDELRPLSRVRGLLCRRRR